MVETLNASAVVFAKDPTRLDYPVESIENSRLLARFLGGDIDETPPPWAERDLRFCPGCDPEGSVFGVRERSAGYTGR